MKIDNISPKHFSRAEVQKMIDAKGWTVREFLSYFQTQGYLLHGSPRADIKKFMPSIPGDLRSGWTTTKGVYASSTEQPIFFALIHRDKVKGEVYMESSVIDGQEIYAVSKDVKNSNAIMPGFVYILERDGFIENPDNQGEWMCPEPVSPVGSVPVVPEDLGSRIRTVKIPHNVTDWKTYVPEYLD